MCAPAWLLILNNSVYFPQLCCRILTTRPPGNSLGYFQCFHFTNLDPQNTALRLDTIIPHFTDVKLRLKLSDMPRVTQFINGIAISMGSRDFPGGPVAKTPCFQCGRCGFHPCLGNKDPTCCAVWPKSK